MRKQAFLFAILALVGVVSAEPETKPAATRPESVTLKGTIKIPAGELVKVIAVDRQWADVLKVSKEEASASTGDPFVYPATLKEGGFTIPKLLPGRTYDLIVWTKSGGGGAGGGDVVRWEGVAMDYHRPIVPDKPMQAEDKKWIEDFITKVPEFYDKCRPLWMAADHKHATVVVELMRTQDFFASKGGEVIYRTEVWYFENLFGGWEKDRNTERVIARWRGDGGRLPPWQVVPQLGGIAIAPDGTYPKIEITLPEKPSEKHGATGPLKK